MRIIRCHIENFGKISDMTLDFTEGMNVINQPNAWGKSTLAAFIKVMFYGLESKKEAGAVDRERNLYRPWQGGAFGGELDFETGGRTYRISRTFGKSEKFDEFHIYDLSTNLESVDFTAKVGEELFDLDGQSFKRSVFIAQSECVGQTTDAINAKLGNLAANTNDMNNYETAQETLKNLINQMSPTRSTGSIRRRKSKLLEMEQELRSYDVAEVAIRDLQSRQEASAVRKQQLMEQRDACAVELQAASEESRREEQRKTYLSLCREQEQKLETLVSLSDTFSQGVPSEEEFAEYIRKARAMEEEATGTRHLELTEQEREAYSRYQMMFAEGCPTDEEVDAQLEKLDQLTEWNKEHTGLQIQLSEREKEWLQMGTEPAGRNPKFPAIGIVGLVLAPLGLAGEIIGATPLLGLPIVLETIYMLFCACVFVVGVALILTGIHGKAKAITHIQDEQQAWEQKRQQQRAVVEDLKNKEAECNQRIWDANHGVRLFLEQYQIFCSVKDFAAKLYDIKNQTREYQRLTRKKEGFNAACTQGQNLREELVAFGLRYGFRFDEDVVAHLTNLQTEAAKYRIAAEAVEDCKARLEQFESRTDMEALREKSSFAGSLEEINSRIHALDDELEEVRGTIEQYGRQIEELQAQLDAKEEREGEFALCREQQDREEHKYDVIVATQELLARAKESFTARYMAPITKAFQKYYSMLTESGEDDWMIDANITFHKREYGELRDSRLMSAGYQDLVGICMRLALVDAMYQEEKPFLVLDDPFVNLDEEKTKRGMELLQNVSGDYQTIYFTCHSSREP